MRDVVALVTRELSREEQFITSLSGTFRICSNVAPAREIVYANEEGRYTSTQVVTALIESTVRAQDETECITEGGR